MPSLKGKLSKAGLVGLTGAILSVVVLGGLQPIPVSLVGVWVPKALVHGVVLSVSSLAASEIVPRITPYISIGSPQLTRFDDLVITPLVVGGVFLAVESIVAPAAEVQGTGGSLREIMAGAAASVFAGYVSEGMGFSETVMG